MEGNTDLMVVGTGPVRLAIAIAAAGTAENSAKFILGFRPG